MNSLKKLVLILIVSFYGCKKSDTEEANYDVSNNIFRILTSSDVNYKLSIYQIYPSTSTDTISKIVNTGLLDINYGFTPIAGSRVVVEAVAPNATKLKCTIVYKGAYLGGSDIVIKNNAHSLHFEHTLNN